MDEENSLLIGMNDQGNSHNIEKEKTGDPSNSSTKPKNVNNTKLYEELKLHYEQGWNVKNTIEGKANSIITAAGTITTLLFGFTTFAKEFLTNPSVPLYLIIISIVLSSIAIFVSIGVIRIRNYNVPIDMKKTFFDQSGKIDTNIITRYKKAEDDDLDNNLIDRYIEAISNNDALNVDKADKVERAFWFLLFSIILITISIIVTIAFS